MTRVAAVKVAVGSDDRKTYAEMLKTTQRRRRVDKAKVHQALALLARDLDLFVASFNSRLKAIAQLTFHDSPDDLRVASIARSQEKKKRSRRAGARVQRGRRNEAKRGRGVEASPNPLFRATNEEDTAKSPKGRWREPQRKVSAVVSEQQPKKTQQKEAESTGQFVRREEKRPALVVQEGAVGASSTTVALKREERAVGSAPMAAASGWRDQLSEARQRTEAAEARAEQAGSEIAGWQVAGEFAKAKVSEAKEAAKTAREEAVKMVAAAKETGQVAKQEAAASYS